MKERRPIKCPVCNKKFNPGPRQQICSLNCIQTRYYRNHTEKTKKMHKKYRDKHKEQYRNYRLKYAYGNGVVDWYYKQVKIQKGLCALCEQPPNKGKHKTLHIDHNHKTGQLRGLLCGKCNMHLGFVENKKFLKAALEYLKCKK